MIAHVQATGGFIAVPPGRYFLGPPTGPRPGSEARADIVVGHKVGLMFMSGGQLIPIRVMPGEASYPSPLPPWMNLGEPYKVRLEIQGFVEAGIHPIFDVFLDGPREAPRQETGEVIFTRQGVSRVYPEWWGAVPAASDLSNVDGNVARRTTKALQAAIDAARPPFLDRSVSFEAALGRHARGTVHHQVRDRATDTFRNGPFHGVAFNTEGRQFYDTRTGMPFARQSDAATALEEYRYVFNDLPKARPALPVVLTNDYVIDDELSVGHARAKVDQPPTTADRVFRTVNHDGVVLLGDRGAALTRAGNVRLIAWRESARFRAEPGGGASEFPAPPVGAVPPEPNRPPYGFVSMLGLREVFGAQVKNITFDASGVAPRCVTLEDVGAGQQHHNGFEGCSFLNARAELVHIGAELLPVRGPVAGGHFATARPTMRYQGNQDLSNMRFVRCFFQTSLAVPEGVASAPSRCAVYSRTGQSFGVEYRACTFQGPANPMVHAVGGRFSLEGCHFRSEPIAGAVRRARLDDSLTVRETTATGRFPDERQVASTSGLDIFIDNPPLDCTEDGVPCVPDRNGFTVSPACFTARDVLSESPQFLATFNDTQRASGTQAATVLQGVRHVPPEGAARPSVHWKGPAEARCALSMMGCEFNTVLVLAAAPLAPVIDLGNRVTAGPTLFTARLGISPGRLFALSR